MNTVTASAPGKLLLFGEHSVVHGHPCIVTAVDQRITVEVRKNGVDIFHLNAPDVGLSAYSKTLQDLGKKDVPKSVAFIENLYKRFLEKYPQQEGIVVTTQSDFSSLFGFGSSSAVTVAFAKALTHLYGLDCSNKELFDLCYTAVLDVQGVGSGFDIASAIWGGTIYYIAPAKVVEAIDVSLENIVIGYTGIKADTPTLIRLVQNLVAEDKEKANGIFQSISHIVEDSKRALQQQDWKKLGELMRQNQALLRQLQVSGVKLEEMIVAAQNSGALGAKLSGAGGGDCMLAVVENGKRKDVIDSLTAVGGTVMDVTLNAQGVTIVSSN